MTRRELQELIIENYPRNLFEHALDDVKTRAGGLLALMTDDAIDDFARTLGKQRRARNRHNARNRAIVAASKERVTV